MRPFSIAALITVVALFIVPERASAARIPIVVIYGWGETIACVSELPANSPARMPGKIVLGGNPTKLGYKHYRWHIFWIPVWTSTSGGEFVAYNESGILRTQYVPLGTNLEEISTNTAIPVSELTVPW